MSDFDLLTPTYEELNNLDLKVLNVNILFNMCYNSDITNSWED